MPVVPYLSFRGDCEAAFAFYERCLGGTIGPMFRYGGSPMAGAAPDGWADKIMHGSITIGDARFGVVVDRFGIPWLINCEG